MEFETSSLDSKAIQVLYAAVEGGSDEILPRACLDTLFAKISDNLFASLGVEESSQSSWDLIALFMTKCTPILIVKVNGKV